MWVCARCLLGIWVATASSLRLGEERDAAPGPDERIEEGRRALAHDLPADAAGARGPCPRPVDFLHRAFDGVLDTTAGGGAGAVLDLANRAIRAGARGRDALVGR